MNSSFGMEEGVSRTATKGVLAPRAVRRGLSGALLLAVSASSMLGFVGEARALDMDPQIEERVKQATVLVFMSVSRQSKGDTKLGSGSGFFLNSTGLLMTNNHVIDPTHGKLEQEKQQFHYTQGKLTFEVVVNSGTEDEKTYEAKMVYQIEAADQALLQAYDEDGQKLETPHYLRLLPENRLHERLRIFAMGFPGGDRQATQKGKHPEVTITKGAVIADGIPYTPGNRIRMIYTDVNVRPGNSGGPSVDLDGFLVGTNTLMTKPDFRDAGAGANYAALVPARLTAQMVRNAFILDKFPDGSDVTPFMSVLTDKKGLVNIPEFDRKDDSIVLYYEDGDRVYGNTSTDTITWNCALGEMELPIDKIAYVISNDEGSHLFIEGGNRIGSDELDSSFTFTPRGGEETEMSFDEVKTVAFKKSENIEPLRGEVIVLDSDLTYLQLKDVEGKVTFEGKQTKQLALTDIERIETNEFDEQVLTLKSGERLTGEFSDDTLEAVIASTGTPIEFSLEQVQKAVIERLWFGSDEAEGLHLEGILANANKNVAKLLTQLEEKGEVKEVAEITGKWISDKKDFRSRSSKQQDHIRLLNGVANLRLGEYRKADRAFAKAKRSQIDTVAVYAKACADLLKRHQSSEYKYDGQPLSDQKALLAAGRDMAWETLRNTRIRLKDARKLKYENQGDYFNAVNEARKLEPSLQVAAVFLGELAEDEMIRVWRLAERASFAEIDRIEAKRREMQGGGGGGGRGGRGGRGGARGNARNRGGGQMQRELQKLEEHQEKVIEKLVSFRDSLWDYGFRIEDPDIQERRERIADREGYGRNDD
ncbi:MAG: S1 family peptidase [Phycisphaerae bacterium]